jgi:hypothetical protein
VDKTPIAWNGIETFGLLDAPGAPGVNKQLEGKRGDKTKAQTSPKRRCPDQLAATACRWLQGLALAAEYTPATIAEVVRLLALWADWVHASGFEVEALARGFAASASVFRGGKTTRAPQGAAALFIACLREKNVLPPERQPSLEETWPALAAFRRWIQEQRGVKDSTLDTYQAILVDLLVSLGADPAAYTAAAIRTFVLNRAKPHGRGRAQGITVATRAYLKYLVATGQCPVGREQAVPSFANWQLATTPRSSDKPTSTACLPLVTARIGCAIGPSSCSLPAWVSGQAKSPISPLMRLTRRPAG